MQNLDIIIDPIIGTVIGFGTNFIAVKMLFRPYKPVKIGKFILPFTPGVIPKRREKLALALGNAISDQLFTSDDIKKIFLSDNVKELVINGMIKEITNNDLSIKEILKENISEEKYIYIRKKIALCISKKICDGLINMNIGEVIATEGAKSIKEKIRGNFFGNFISDDFIMSIVGSTGKKVEDYIKENGEEKILPYVDKEIEDIMNKTISNVISISNDSEDNLKDFIERLYIKIIEDKMKDIFGAFDISKVVVDKINLMDVKDIEKLFMSVMKKELNAIINLGAVLGFLLGVLNIFI